MLLEFNKVDMNDLFVIPKILIDKYLVSTNGEYIKIYLYLLRNYKKNIELSTLADDLDILESDIKRAVKFWEKKGLLRIVEAHGKTDILQENIKDNIEENIEENIKTENIDKKLIFKETSKQEQSKVSDINLNKEAQDFKYTQVQELEKIDIYPQNMESQNNILNLSQDKFKEKENNIISYEENVNDIRDIKNSIDMQKLKDSEDFTKLMTISKIYLKKLLSQTDMQSLAYMYDVLKLPYDLIEYIIEDSFSKGKYSFRYIETIAIAFYDKGIRTLAEAKKVSLSQMKKIWSVMKAFGIKNREPVKKEIEYINKWFDKYCFQGEIVIEACNRTINTIFNPSFSYADSILTNWYENKVRTMEDIKIMDKKYELKAEQKNIKIPKTKNSFNKFPQRNNEINEEELYGRIL